MNPEQAAAYIIAQAACANAEIAAMQAANEVDKRAERSLTYDAQHFLALTDRYCIGHNAVMTLFQEVNR